MTLTSAFLWFLLPFLGSYLATKLFQHTPEPYKPKEYKNLFDPEDHSTWNYSYARLMRMKND